MLTIDVLRHGALQGGVKYRGSVDDPLTEQGRTAMDEVWQQLQGEVKTIISSPLSRCAQPAQDWAAASDISCVLEPQLQEMYYGEWEGLTAEEIELAYSGMLQAWRKDPSHMTPPKGEAMSDFSLRIAQVLQGLQQYEDDEHVLVVAHSGTIRLLIAHALQAPIVSTRHLHMPYACWSRLSLKNGVFSLVFHAKTV